MGLAHPRPHWRRDQYRLSEEERAAWRDGSWLGVKLPEHRTREMTDEGCAAELAARVRLMLEER